MDPTITASATEDHYRARIAGPWDNVARVSHCVDCLPTGCPLVAYVRDGVVVREESPGDLPPVEDGVPDANPMVCQKGLAWSQQMLAPDRLLHPLRRVGERGSGSWEEITWDEALGEVADAILDAIEEVGPESVVHEGSPELAALVPAARFVRLIGGTNLDVNGSINDFWAGLHQVFGKFYVTPSVDDTFHSDCILIWHANPAYTGIPSFHYITEARYRGARVVLLAPDVSPSHVHADLHVPVAHGTDAALALAMCQVVLDEGLADLDFVRAQTDLSLLVRCDDGRFLREADVTGGSAERFYHAHPGRGPVIADPTSLDLDFEPALEGTLTVTTNGGASIKVEPLLARVRRVLDQRYTPEEVAGTCGAHPDTIRTVARWVAGGRTRLVTNAGMAKYYHGDLIARSILLLFGLTGNWGRKGAGGGAWAVGMFDGQTLAMGKDEPGIAGTEAFMGGLEAMTEAMRSADPTLTGTLASAALWRSVGQSLGMVPPAFFWYWHAGFRDRWDDPTVNDPAMPKPFGELLDEAIAAGWWGPAAAPGPDKPPRVLLEIAGNTLRRTRGGMNVLLEHLWPQLSKVVVCDVRMSQTARYADLVLPAAHHYEKPGFGMPTPWTMMLSYSDRAVPPAGESRTEWDMLGELCTVIADRAAARGLESFTDAMGMEHRYAELWDRYTLGGTMVTDEDLADEMVRDSVHTGNLPPDTTLDTLRRDGWVRYRDWGFMGMAQGQASPFPDGETHAPLRDHVERGLPYPTLTRRAQFLLDHPWFVQAGEDLPAHKDPPPMGGNHRFRLSGGHNRWSVHSMNTTNPVLLQTHRGKPFILVNEDDAAELGIDDDAPVRVWNDVGEFVVHARTSPAQRPGALTVYNGFEGFMFEGGAGPNEVEPGLVKWLGLAGGYGHLAYAPTEWQPVPADRCLNVDIEPAHSAP